MHQLLLGLPSMSVAARSVFVTRKVIVIATKDTQGSLVPTQAQTICL